VTRRCPRRPLNRSGRYAFSNASKQGAVETLADLLGTAAHPAVRLGAARTVAELAQHQFDAETILRKLDTLEDGQQRR
jgi:ribosomal protein S12 methylthiotransferase accessory factor YcaO